MKPRIFIGSSVESLDIAYAAQEGLEHSCEVTVWSQGIFAPSKYTMESLIDTLDDSDFGAFIFTSNDVTRIRGQDRSTVRDNVIFEIGLFVGRLGKERTFIIVPRGSEEVHFPSDLLGVTPVSYESDRQDSNTVAALGPACNRIRKAILRLGPLEKITAALEEEAKESADNLVSDPNDCVSIIEAWMGKRPSSENTEAIRFTEVDRILGLYPGSAQKYLKVAAQHWGYEVRREGKDVVILEHRGYEF